MAGPELKALILLGKERGFLWKTELLAELPQDISDPEQIEAVVQMFSNLGIEVRDMSMANDER